MGLTQVNWNKLEGEVRDECEGAGDDETFIRSRKIVTHIKWWRWITHLSTWSMTLGSNIVFQMILCLLTFECPETEAGFSLSVPLIATTNGLYKQYFIRKVCNKSVPEKLI